MPSSLIAHCWAFHTEDTKAFYFSLFLHLPSENKPETLQWQLHRCQSTLNEKLNFYKEIQSQILTDASFRKKAYSGRVKSQKLHTHLATETLA